MLVGYGLGMRQVQERRTSDHGAGILPEPRAGGNRRRSALAVAAPWIAALFLRPLSALLLRLSGGEALVVEALGFLVAGIVAGLAGRAPGAQSDDGAGGYGPALSMLLGVTLLPLWLVVAESLRSGDALALAGVTAVFFAVVQPVASRWALLPAIAATAGALLLGGSAFAVACAVAAPLLARRGGASWGPLAGLALGLVLTLGPQHVGRLGPLASSGALLRLLPPTRLQAQPVPGVVDDAGAHKVPLAGPWTVTLPVVFGVDSGPRVLLGDFGPGALDLARRIGVHTWSPATDGLDGPMLRWPLEGLPLAEDPAFRAARSVAPPVAGPAGAIMIDVPEPGRRGAARYWSAGSQGRLREAIRRGWWSFERIDLRVLDGEDLRTVLGSCGSDTPCWLIVESDAPSTVVLVRGPPGGTLRAQSVFAAWEKDPVRWGLSTASIHSVEGFFDRVVAGPDSIARGPANAAVDRGAQRGSLRLSSLKPWLASGPIEVDLDALEPKRAEALQRRLEAAARAREPWIETLVAVAAGDLARAHTFARRMLDLDAAPAESLHAVARPWLERGQRALDAGDLSTAERELRLAFALAPSDEHSARSLAEVLRRAGRLDESAGVYEQLLAARPGHLDASLGLAAARRAQGRLADAAEALDRVEPLYPGSYALLTNLGHLETQLARGSEANIAARLGRARVLLQRAVALEPRRPQAHAALAECWWRFGDAEQALESIDRALALDPACDYRAWRGLLLFDLRRLEEAEGELHQALLRCPDHRSALLSLGGVQVDLGRPKQAADTWSRLLELDPNNEQARTNLDALKASPLLDVAPQNFGR